MLYVFYVNCGQAHELSLELVTRPVTQLQLAIHQQAAIAPHDQVLLVNHGQFIDDPSTLVSAYNGAGTESNPIFVINRALDAQTINFDQLHNEQVRLIKSLVAEFDGRSAGCASVGTSFDKVQQQSALARDTAARVQGIPAVCQRLVDDQRLLHQGWQALVANLDATLAQFVRRADRFCSLYDKFMQQRDKALQLLGNFQHDLQLLNKIVLPSCLTDSQSSEDGGAAGRRRTSSASDFAMSPSGMSPLSHSTITLLDWINKTDPNNSLTELAVTVREHLQLMDPVASGSMREWRDRAQSDAARADMKEIGGIDKRFYSLDTHLVNVSELSRLVCQLAERTAAQEQRCLSAVRDEQTLTATCVCQRDSLQLMRDKLAELVDLADRFDQSKVELLKVINVRLKWITELHQQLGKAEAHRSLCNEKLGVVKKRLAVLRQVHEAPSLYACAVVEVLRRRMFADEFVTWSHELVDKVQRVHREESEIRDDVHGRLSRHFIRSLFPGLSDQVPSFACEKPPEFDRHLPQINTDHLRHLRESCPSLAHLLRVRMPKVAEQLGTSPHHYGGYGSGSLERLHRTDSFMSTTAAAGLAMIRHQSMTSFGGSGEHLADISPGSSAGGTAASAGAHQRHTVPFMPCSPMAERQPYREVHVDAAAFQLGTSPMADVPAPVVQPSIDESSNVMTSSVSSAAVKITPSSAGNSEQVARSAPIQIPGQMQLTCSKANKNSEDDRHDHFGTPEGQLHSGSSADFCGPSPPEFVTRSQIAKMQQHYGAQSAAGRPRVIDCTTRSSESNEMERTIVGSSGSCVGHRHTQTEAADDECCIDVEAANQAHLQQRCEKLEWCCRQQHALLTSTLRALAQDLRSLRAVCSDGEASGVWHKQTLITTINQAARNIEAGLQTQMSEATEAALTERTDQFAQDLDKLKHQVEVQRQATLDAEKLANNYEALVQQKDDEIQYMMENSETAEKQWLGRLEEEKSEIIKQLTIDYELQLDAVRQQAQNDALVKEVQLQNAREEVKQQQQLLAKLKAEQEQLLAKLMNSCTLESSGSFDEGGSGIESAAASQLGVDAWKQETEAQERQQAEIKAVRAELEKQFKDKLSLLTKGMEERHVETVNRLKKEHEIEMRHQKRIHSLELDNQWERAAEELTTLQQQLDELRLQLQEYSTTSDDQSAKTMAESVYDYRPLTQSMPVAGAPNVLEQAGPDTAQDVMAVSAMPAVQQPAEADHERIEREPMQESVMLESMMQQANASNASLGSGGSPTAAVVVCAAKTQTRLRLKDMALMVAVTDAHIRPGALVLVVWNQPIRAHVLFTCTTAWYVVKERSVQALGLPLTADGQPPNPQPTLARVSAEPEYCQIKKENNRYNLPFRSRFYRVECELPAARGDTDAEAAVGHETSPSAQQPRHGSTPPPAPPLPPTA